MLNQEIKTAIRRSKLEPELERFLAEPRATLTRIGPNSEQPLHYVALRVGDTIVASATSQTGYVDALGAALWALEIWRESVRNPS